MGAGADPDWLYHLYEHVSPVVKQVGVGPYSATRGMTPEGDLSSLGFSPLDRKMGNNGNCLFDPHRAVVNMK